MPEAVDLEPNEHVRKYRESSSLTRVTAQIGSYLTQCMSNTDDDWCLGVHLRHVFDTDAPSVWVSANNQKYIRIREESYGKGQQTLNHVLDSLLEPAPGGEDSVEAYVEIEFDKDPPDSRKFDHVLDFLDAGPEYRKELESFLEGDSTDLRVACRGHCFRPRALEFSATGVLRPDDYVCGADKLCKTLGITQTSLNYRSVWSAIAQLSKYSDAYGELTSTFFLRPRDPFGFVVGFTLIGGEAAVRSLRPSLITALRNTYVGLNGSTVLLPFEVPPDTEAQLAAIIKYTGFRFGATLGASNRNLGDSQTAIVKTLAMGLAGNRAERHPLDFFKLEQLTPFNDCETLNSFIQMASQFCDERSEGRQLRFGLLLANPDLLFYWSGPSPIPLADESGFEQVGAIAKQYHLIDDPEERTLVIPYIPTDSPDFEPKRVGLRDWIPAFAVELRHFKEVFEEDRSLSFWAEEFRPYVYFTQRHGWCIGCVAGPFSELRLFFRGQLLAFRDGKGWRLADRSAVSMSPWENLLRFPGLSSYWSENQERALVLETLIRIGFQLSRFVNRKGKGGLILFSVLEEVFERLDVRGVRLSPDHDVEPPIVLRRLEVLEPMGLLHEGGRDWLRERCLQEDSWSTHEIAHRIVRACSKDGAVVVCGDQGKILEYAVHASGRRRSEDCDDEPGARGGLREEPGKGTKHRAAEDFVGILRDLDHAALAICVSEDGEIRLTFSVDGEGQRELRHQTYFEKERYD